MDVEPLLSQEAIGGGIAQLNVRLPILIGKVVNLLAQASGQTKKQVVINAIDHYLGDKRPLHSYVQYPLTPTDTAFIQCYIERPIPDDFHNAELFPDYQMEQNNIKMDSLLVFHVRLAARMQSKYLEQVVGEAVLEFAGLLPAPIRNLNLLRAIKPPAWGEHQGCWNTIGLVGEGQAPLKQVTLIVIGPEG